MGTRATIAYCFVFEGYCEEVGMILSLPSYIHIIHTYIHHHHTITHHQRKLQDAARLQEAVKRHCVEPPQGRSSHPADRTHELSPHAADPAAPDEEGVSGSEELQDGDASPRTLASENSRENKTRTPAGHTNSHRAPGRTGLSTSQQAYSSKISAAPLTSATNSAGHSLAPYTPAGAATRSPPPLLSVGASLHSWLERDDTSESEATAGPARPSPVRLPGVRHLLPLPLSFLQDASRWRHAAVAPSSVSSVTAASPFALEALALRAAGTSVF